MRITYRTLADLIDLMSDDQKDCDVTVQLDENEFYPAELRISMGYDSLDDEHPIIYPHHDLESGDRRDDVERIWEEIQ